MKIQTLSYLIIITFLVSCGLRPRCETLQEWEIQNYKIKKINCPDYVLKSSDFFRIYLDEKEQSGKVSQVDSCSFFWLFDNKDYMAFNSCNNSMRKMRIPKTTLHTETIDSITMFSEKANQKKLFSRAHVKRFVEDYNKSNTYGYSEEPFDSSRSVSSRFEYRLTVYSKGSVRCFDGGSYLLLDNSNWKFQMS